MEAGLRDAELFFTVIDTHVFFLEPVRLCKEICGSCLEASGAIGTSIFTRGKFDEPAKISKRNITGH